MGRWYIMFIDLHLHTTASDGFLAPERVVDLAIERGLAVIAVTDHDTVDGIQNAIGYALTKPLKVIPGVELSTESEDQEVHIIGYYIDYKNASFNDQLKLLREYRLKRARRIIKRLEQLGMMIDFDRVLEISGPGSVGRPHIAKAMVEQNYVTTIKDAFNRYLGIGKPAYVPRKKLTPVEAINIIKKNDGISVLAHPGLLKDDSLIEYLAQRGLDGLEVIHKEHDEKTIHKYNLKADALGLIKTGGSDCHGIKPYILGTLNVPIEYYQELVNYKVR
jgi:predicted metal-dependent phosphoesterase TrpH